MLFLHSFLLRDTPKHDLFYICYTMSLKKCPPRFSSYYITFNTSPKSLTSFYKIIQEEEKNTFYPFKIKHTTYDIYKKIPGGC